MTTQSIRLYTPKKARKISLTPLIDVVFILLIFFMLASHFNKQSLLPLQAQHNNAINNSQSIQPITIKVTKKQFYLNEKAINKNELIAIIKKNYANSPLFVQPLQNTPLQEVVTLLHYLNSHGVTHAQLIADEKYPNES